MIRYEVIKSNLPLDKPIYVDGFEVIELGSTVKSKSTVNAEGRKFQYRFVTIEGNEVVLVQECVDDPLKVGDYVRYYVGFDEFTPLKDQIKHRKCDLKLVGIFPRENKNAE